MSNADLAHDLTESLRATLPSTLIATDFDGTLAPLVPDPERSRPVDGAIDALAALAAAGADIAVITGRDAETVVRLGQLERVPHVVVAGIYGIETWRDGAVEAPDTPPVIRALHDRLPRLLEDNHADPAIWIEDKRLSLVVHARKAADPPAALAPLREPLNALADELDLEAHPGHGVVELRLPGYDKAGALRRLAGSAAEHRGVLYLGDDLGDIPAFDEIRRLRDEGRTAWSVAVRASGVDEAARAADLAVDTAEDAVAILRAIAG